MAFPVAFSGSAWRNSTYLGALNSADGWVLTCRSEPITPDVTVSYDDCYLMIDRCRRPIGSDMLAS
jgi:hypothetical protein